MSVTFREVVSAAEWYHVKKNEKLPSASTTEASIARGQRSLRSRTDRIGRGGRLKSPEVPCDYNRRDLHIAWV